MVRENLAKVHSRAVEKMDELKNMELIGQAGGGAVTAVASGLGELKSIRIDREKLDPVDWDLLEDLIVVAVREALGKAEEEQRKAGEEVLKDFPLAGLLGLGR
ncbi:MAG: YbaB/EbfC family nucleoid-associated protein [Armatimonadetes bacterium]|nr:YbaB/EbfC family nucleoid-associated protein [Armatimonadota bacterium]MDW8122130.1 YbaB/EbfC family nucleoid-associated protein [Armatimonadota bacterium]